jgi:hypothetical protein
MDGMKGIKLMEPKPGKPTEALREGTVSRKKNKKTPLQGSMG